MKFREILEAAILAPSGDNCQPWRFEIEGDEIRIFNVPNRDTSLFNYKQRASFVAHGALIENLVIAAPAFGYEATVTLCPEGINSELVASVVLHECESYPDELFPFIVKRGTNRKPYKGTPLTTTEKQMLLQTIESNGFLVDGEGLARVAEIISVNDKIVFENRDLHNFLFEHIRWNEREATETLNGLDVRTLELSPPDSIVFPLFKNWPLVTFLNKFAFSRMVAANARKLVMSSSAVGVITSTATEHTNYIEAGRLLQRVWLQATKLGLALQPMTGITFLMQRVVDGDTASLSEEHCRLILETWRNLNSMIPAGIPVVLFRIGKGDNFSARSLRMSVEENLYIPHF